MTWPQTRTHLINRQRARCSRFAAAARREEDPYPSWIFDRRATQPQRQIGATRRACFKIRKGAAAGDFGCGQGGEAQASPVSAPSGVALCSGRANAGRRQKTRRPEGFRGKGRLASLLLSRRSTRDILLRRALPSSHLHENSTLQFKTGTKSADKAVHGRT